MSLKDIFAKDMESIRLDFDNPLVTWNEEDYVCVVSSNIKGNTLEQGGFGLEDDITFNIAYDDFANGILPKASQHLTYKSNRYRIREVRTDGTQAFVRLLCQFENKGM